jgi:hypothetical protein
MDKVNVEKTVEGTDVLMCSTYLSVGVDILDRYDFNIYFNDIWMPQEMEQFANRLRSHDLFINIYINKYNAAGDYLNIFDYHPCNFRIDDEELRNIHAILRSCNAMLERNQQEYKYNPIIGSIITNNVFVEYNEVENKYYLNETAYKIIMFERRYRDYVQQLPVLVRGMMDYGYHYNCVDVGEFTGDVNSEFIKSDDIPSLIKSVTQQYATHKASQTTELLDHITDDILRVYRDAMTGRYAITKGTSWNENVVDRIITARNVEVFEQVVPVFVSLSHIFAIGDIRDVFECCRNKNGTYNISAVYRIKTLAKLVYNEKNNRIDIPISDFMRDTYRFVDDHDGEVTVQQYMQYIQDHSVRYARNDSTTEIIIERSSKAMDFLYKKLDSIFKCLVNVSRPKKVDGNRVVTLDKAHLMWTDIRDKRSGFDFEDQLKLLDEFFNAVQ